MRTLLATVLLASTATATAADTGDLWEVSTRMEMAGMQMPGQSQQVCAPKGAQGPEAMGAGEDGCRMRDVSRSAGRFAFHVDCPNGSGDGEMTYDGDDAYTMRMTMTAEGQQVTMVSAGRRIGGCDAGVADRQVDTIAAGAQAQAAGALQQGCAYAVESLMPPQLATYQCDDSHRARLCERFGTRDGFLAVAPRQPVGNPLMDGATLPEVARFCGVDAAALRARLCDAAAAADDLEFIGGQCPSLATPIVQRECAGRSFTSPPAEKYRDFCNDYARTTMMAQPGTGSPAAPPAGAPAAGSAIEEAGRRLKGLFGR